MSKQEQNNKDPLLLDHEYDGIQELDNPLPNWWLVTFLGAVIFGFIYWVHYTFGGGATLQEEFKVAMEALPKAAEIQMTDQELESKAKEPETLVKGKAIFVGKCVPCHGAEGQGIIGPNLTDKFWINGKGHRAEIASIISKGVIEKGMPPWGPQLSHDELAQVAIFVYSLRNTKPANPKAPQGAEVND